MSYNSSLNNDVVKTKINKVVVPGKTRFRIRTNNRLKGAYAITDLKKKTITINKKKHKTKPTHKKRYPELLDTRVHEIMHAEHPNMTEKQVRKKTPKKIRNMSRKQKQKVYSKSTVTVNNNYEYR